MTARHLIASLLLTVTMTDADADNTLQWGDQDNGTYRNPVLNADYSDPDVIRVGEKYYMVASDFHFMGMQILESCDMVNWRIVTQVYNRFDMPKWDTNERYAGGSWAPALRYHDGKYWIFFCTPHEGLFMTQAEKPEGPWSPLHCLKAVEKWEDPCPFWDSDGRAYLGRSQHGAGPIILHRMSPDGSTLLDDGVTIYTGPVAEGTKFLKRGDWYYLSIPEGGVGEGWQTVLRSKNIYGPYERKVVLEQGTTTVNGPHQGALVDTPQGTWWFYHFQETEALGRVVHLQPVEWKDGWPMIGTDIDGNGIGEPVMQWQNPLSQSEPSLPQTSDDFNGGQLSPQWQWNHNPANEAWSLTENHGVLTLHALQSESFIKARNTLTQKSMGYDSEATVEIDFAHLADGGRAGIACMGKTNELLGVRKDGNALQLYRTLSTFKQKDGTPPTERDTMICSLSGTTKLWLRIHFDVTAKQFTFSYSTDGTAFTPAAPFYTIRGNWKGIRLALYHYNTRAAEGYVSIGNVKYNINK